MDTLLEEYVIGGTGVSEEMIIRATDEVEKGKCEDRVIEKLLNENSGDKKSPIDSLIEKTGFPEKSGINFLKRKMIDFVNQKKNCIEPCVKKDNRKQSIRNFVQGFLK